MGRPHFDVCGGRHFVITVGNYRSLPRSPFRGRISMKQSAAKTLGVAALGAAFAAAGAGAANAAPAVPDTSQALNTVTQSVPARKATTALPAAADALATGRGALATGAATARPAAGRVLSGGAAAPVQPLLGGVPVGKALPGRGLGVNGLPVN
jgi:hypothetical protein